MYGNPKGRGISGPHAAISEQGQHQDSDQCAASRGRSRVPLFPVVDVLNAISLLLCLPGAEVA